MPDYPKKKLDIKLVLEADDGETIAAAEALKLDNRFEIIRVPVCEPRTKPKACNYALNFARGEFLVIYDAEDRPEPDQLKKAVAAFRAAPPEIACLQARLNFYNASENFLTCMFALDYALWFDFLLPGLDALGVPMPLGGTSNHFRTDALRAIHGWDSYNVTEDADLGIRLSQMGYRVSTLDSTTFEEATNELGNWMRQRSRWLKGYMQTWLVHMRSPRRLLRNAGWRGFFCFQLFIGGTVLTALLSPVLWALSLLPLVPGIPHLPDPFSVIIPVPVLGLLIGNSLFTYLAMLGPYRRGWLSLSPYGLAAPFYWLLISLAAYRGAFQLFTKPWHWEKTRHGTSLMAAR
jgi:glycosyltransferase XagB